MQVSKGLKRATGRDEQVQHHLGTLNFWRHRRIASFWKISVVILSAIIPFACEWDDGVEGPLAAYGQPGSVVPGKGSESVRL